MDVDFDDFLILNKHHAVSQFNDLISEFQSISNFRGDDEFGTVLKFDHFRTCNMMLECRLLNLLDKILVDFNTKYRIVKSV